MNKWLFSVLIAMLSFKAIGQSPSPDNVGSQNQFSRSTRPTNEIKQVWPFDIKLISDEEKLMMSPEVLVSNGKPTVVMFWLTTCVPCRYELAAISGKYAEWIKEADFNFYAISIDFPPNYPQFLKRVEESKWPFPAYFDLNQEFMWVIPGNLNGLPQVFVMDKNGKIVHRAKGFVHGDEDKLFAFIKGMK